MEVARDDIRSGPRESKLESEECLVIPGWLDEELEGGEGSEGERRRLR